VKNNSPKETVCRLLAIRQLTDGYSGSFFSLLSNIPSMAVKQVQEFDHSSTLGIFSSFHLFVGKKCAVS